MPSDTEPYRAHADVGVAINRFQGDWVMQYMFSTLYFLPERQQSTYAFLKNGGIKWACKTKDYTPAVMAKALRVSGGRSLQSIAGNKDTPQLVRDALEAMQIAEVHIMGTDGQRRLCRHEGHAYMGLFGAPLIFATPNLADTK